MLEPTLKNYIARYNLNKELLEKHPENKALIERKLKEAEQDIIAYVTNENFVAKLDYLNL